MLLLQQLVQLLQCNTYELDLFYPLYKYFLVSFMTLKTLAALDWLVLSWLEWNLALLTTVSTSCIVHFSISSI